MANLTPVDFDPFADKAAEPTPTLTPVDFNPFEERSAVERMKDDFKDALSRSWMVEGYREGYKRGAESDLSQPKGLRGLLPENPAASIGAVVGAWDNMFDDKGADAEAAKRIAEERARREAFEARSKADPFYKAGDDLGDKVVHGGAALAGTLGSAVFDPTSYVSGGSSLLPRLGVQGAVAAATDVVAQDSAVQSGVQDKYDPLQTGLSAGAGVAFQGASDALGAVAKPLARRGGELVDGVKARVGEFVDGFGKSPAPAPRELNLTPVDHTPDFGPTLTPVDHTPDFGTTPKAGAHVDDVWDNLTRQESGNRQFGKDGKLITSSAGAGGVAQLMPATAKEVATKIGQPELADLAFQPTEAGRAANEKLGKIYYQQMLDRFDGDHQLAAAAYNAGPGRVSRALKKWGRADVLDHLPAETQHYVKVVARDTTPRARGPEDLTLVRDEFGGFAEPERVDVSTREPAPATIADDAEFTPTKTEDFFDNDNPIPTTATKRPAPEPEPVDDPLTDKALDAIRSGKRVTEDRGPTLLEWVQQHGLKDDGGELRAIGADQWHRAKPFRRQIVREDGRAIDDLAVAAQENGYLPQRVGDGDTRAQPQDLIDAIREEIAGRPRFAREDPEGAALKQRVADLDEVLTQIGIDPKTKTNAEIQQAINAYWRQPEPDVGLRGAGAAAMPERAAAMPERLGLGGSAMAPQRAPTAPDIQPEGFGPMGERLQSTKGSLPHQRVPQAISAADAAPYNGRTIGDLMHDLRVSLDLTHRRGRLRGRKSLGEYDTKSGVVRTKHADDLDVLVHEAAHKVEFTDKLPTLEAAMKKHEKELKPLDYDPMQKRRHEGFAEWVRHYVTNPEVAKTLAPNFHKDFEAAMAVDNPKALAAMQAIARDWDNYLKAGSLEVGKADLAMTGDKGGIAKAKQTVKDKGLGGALEGVFDRAYTWFVDDLSPLAKAEQKLGEVYKHHKGEALEIKGAESPYVHARLSRDAFQAGRVDALHGVVPYKGIDPEGPSLGDAITKVFGKKWDDDKLNGFDVYLASRRMVTEWDRFSKGEITRPPDKFSKAVHQQRIADFEAEHPEAKEGAELVYEWIGNLWKKEYEAGFLTEMQYKEGLKKPDYVPLMRDMSDTRGMGGKTKGDGKNAGGVKRFGGSRRAVVSPLTSMMKRAYELNVNIRRNEVVGTLDALAQKAGPGSGAIIERLPEKELEAYNTDALAALEKAMKENDLLSPMDATTILAAADAALDGDGKVQMFRRRATEAKPGETVVYHWKDGRKIPLMLADGEFGRELYTAIAGMDRQMQSGLVDFMSGFTQVLRTGVTLSPEFVGANIVRDQLATWINTDVGFKPFLSYAAGAKEQLADGQWSKRYQAAGGMKGGLNTSALTKPLPGTDALARKQRLDLNKANMRARTFRLNQNPLHLAAALTDLSETGSRLAVFKLAFNKAKKEGLSDYEAAVQAGITSRDYLDFGRRGSKMLTAVRLVTFLNSWVQGTDKWARVSTGSGYSRPNMGGLGKVLAPIGNNAPKTAAEKAAVAHAWKAAFRIGVIATFGSALTALYADDKEFQELTSQERATAWWFRAGGHWWRIPKPFELAVPANIAERMVEAKITEDPTIGESIVSDLGYTMLPPHGVPAVSVPFEIMSNRDSFGRPIVPDYKRGKIDPELQFTAYTSKLSKAMSKALDGHVGPIPVAPAVLDHIITGFLGSLGRYGLQGSDLAYEAATGKPRTAVGPEDAFFTRRFSGDPMRSSKSQERFWKLMSQDGGEFTRREGTFSALVKQGKDAEATAYLNAMKPEERGYVLAKVFSEKGSSKLHPMVRAQESTKVLGDIREELTEGTLTQLNGDPISLTPAERKRASDALVRLSTAEQRNALIAIGEKGWAEKDYLSRRDPKADLKELGLLQIVEGRQQMAKVPPAGATLRLWQQQRKVFEAPATPEQLGKLMQHKRLKSSDPETKRHEVLRQMRGDSQ